MPAANGLSTSTAPVLGFCAAGSGIGKTTLLTALIPALIGQGLRVSVVKHAHHSFDIDHPGKDSYRLRQAGAVQTMLGSRNRWALVTELHRYESPVADIELSELLRHMDLSTIDLVLVEGFRQAPIPKIEVCRPALGDPVAAGRDPHVIAIATDTPVDSDLPQLNLNDADAIARFIVRWLTQQPRIPATNL